MAHLDHWDLYHVHRWVSLLVRSSFLVWTICEKLYEVDGNLAAGKTVIGLIFIYNTFFNIGWTPLQVVYCIEILPIAIRARGLAIYNISVSLAGFVNQYVNPIGLEKLGWKCECFRSIYADP